MFRLMFVSTDLNLLEFGDFGPPPQFCLLRVAHSITYAYALKYFHSKLIFNGVAD